MAVYDCFPFFNELDLLEIRLNELHEVVDYFVVVEGTRTYQNNEKPLHFEDNKQRFEKFKDKIIHVVINKFSEDSWENEKTSFNVVKEVLQTLQVEPNDFVIVGCADEIIKAEILKRIISTYDGVIHVDHENFCYYMNTQFNSSIWNSHWPGCTVVKYSMLENQPVYNFVENRNSTMGTLNKWNDLKPHGWHFTFLGSSAEVALKVRSYGHKEFNHISENQYTSQIESLADPFGRSEFHSFNSFYPTNLLPKYVQDNKDKFQRFFRKENK